MSQWQVDDLWVTYWMAASIACLGLGRLHVEVFPCDMIILYPKDGYAVPVEPATSGRRTMPVPFGPDRITCGTYAKHVRLKIGNIAEDDRPVHVHLATAAEGAVGMDRPCALIIGRETRNERIDVVPILRLVQARNDGGRISDHTGPPDSFFHRHNDAA